MDGMWGFHLCAGLGKAEQDLMGLDCGSISLCGTQRTDVPCYDGRSTHQGRRSGNLLLARGS